VPAHCGWLRARGAARPLGEQCRARQHDAADQRQYSQPRMDHSTDEEEHWNPRQIDDRDRALSGQKRPDLIEVADRLVRFAALPAGGRQPDDRPVHDAREVLVEKSRRARHYTAADQVYGCLLCEGAAQ